MAPIAHASPERQPTSPAVDDELFAAALNSLSVHVAVIDSAGKIVAVNDAWRRFAAENGGAHHESVVEGADYLGASAGTHDPDGEVVGEGLREILAGRLDEFRHEYPCHSPTELRWFEVRATPLDEDGLTGAVVVHSTVTQRKLAEQRLEFLAYHDELTGLPNRRRMMEALTAAQPRGGLGVMLMDLDRFKAVNDTYGHAAGNDVLCAVAEAIGRPLDGGSLASRHGGDEFCVAVFAADAESLPGLAAELWSRTGERLARLPSARAVSVSIGATLVHRDEPLAQAIKRADDVLYEVKDQGRDGFRVA